MDTKELVERLRITSNMVNMGEKISWGQDTALMDEAADALERLERERDEAAAQIVSAREECPLVRRQDYFGTPLPALVAAQVSELFGWQSRAEAAESELTTLRSRVARLEEAAWFVRDHLAYTLAGPFGTAGGARAIAKIDAALTEEQP